MIEIGEKILNKVIKKRKSATHKGNYGRILLIGGSQNYGGAIIMAAEAAINAGSGLTCVATHSINLTALHTRDPEAMFIDWHDSHLAELIKQMDVVVVGPGLDTTEFAKEIMQLLKEAVSEKQTVVVDASALDLIAKDNNLIPQNAGHIVLTPHQMEWQRVSQIRIPYQDDRANLNALKQLFPNQNAILVLKSNHTHVYDTDGQVYQNPIGNPGMATGGMGDTLSGIIGGMIAQFGAKVETVLAAVYLHSLAGDVIYRDHYIVRPTAVSNLLPQLMKKYEK